MRICSWKDKKGKHILFLQGKQRCLQTLSIYSTSKEPFTVIYTRMSVEHAIADRSMQTPAGYQYQQP